MNLFFLQIGDTARKLLDSTQSSWYSAVVAPANESVRPFDAGWCVDDPAGAFAGPRYFSFSLNA